MNRTPDILNAEIPAAARPRVRLPDAYAPSGVFRGWGPELGR